MTDLAGRLSSALDRYQIQREVGRGGMAVVYLGRDVRYDRVVAVKVMHPDVMAGTGRDRFLREIRIAATLSHPHILPLFDSGEADGLLYYVMPYVHGESLRTRIARLATLPVEEATRLASEVASGLAHAHAQGVVHRDVKPENILLSGDSAVLTDFGIAQALDASGGRLTGTGLFVGSPAYMSPEQVEGVIDHRSDLYALGCVLYEMLCGAPPFAGATNLALLAGHANKTVIPLRHLRPAVPADLESLVLRTLAKNPADRFATAQELARALGRAAGGTVVMTTAGMSEGRSGARALAILRFEDLSPGRDQEYFCEGMAEELRTTLSRVEGLRVLSRTASEGVRGKGLDTPAIGRTLGVTHLLEGTVQSAGNRLRVSITLTGTGDGFQLWSDRYDRNADDVFEIQDDIARRVSEVLRLHLTMAVPMGARRARKPGIEAYRAFLRGRHHWNRRTERSLRQGVRHMEEAIALDPGYAEAYAGLADALVTLGIYGAEPPEASMLGALDAARSALELDPALAEAHAVRGAVQALYQWDWLHAEESFQQAIRRDPGYVTGHHWYANHVLMPNGRFEEAERELRIALEIDPASASVAASRGLLLALQGNDAEAIHQFQGLLDRDPEFGVAHYFLGQVYDRQDRFGAAEAALEQALVFGGESPEVIAMLAYSRARSGRKVPARAGLDRLRALGSSRFVSPALEALVHIGLGDVADAIARLEEAAEVRATELVWLKVRWQYDGLRGWSAFDAIVRRVFG
ncbi:MAG TPA: protein kinase [Gemmatimonadales bacterium]|nr:protein kinase [Gemmatimonadales bacterium]